jgi:hypothetical protein
MKTTDTYNGWTNWGTWHLNLVLSNNGGLYRLTVGWGKHLATLPHDRRRSRFSEGARYLMEQVLELAEYERTEGWKHQWLNETLQREGTAHINWDELAIHYRDAYLEEASDA